MWYRRLMILGAAVLWMGGVHTALPFHACGGRINESSEPLTLLTNCLIAWVELEEAHGPIDPPEVSMSVLDWLLAAGVPREDVMNKLGADDDSPRGHMDRWGQPVRVRGEMYHACPWHPVFGCFMFWWF